MSGPGDVTFAHPISPATTADFSASGTYVLRLTANDSLLTNSDEVTVTVKPKPFSSRVYTLNSDFDEGSVINVVHSVPDQLQLDDTTRAFNFIWVAVSTKGTMVKINTETGAVLGEYRTAPEGQATRSYDSRDKRQGDANLLAGSYTVTPAKFSYTFNPPNLTFNGLSSNQTAAFIAIHTPQFPILIAKRHQLARSR